MDNTRYIGIVDDHTLFRKGLVALIDMFPGYKVLFDAGNGKEFIERLKPPHLPDLVLLDIAMPQMDGYTTAAWIKARYPTIRVLALSTMEGEMAIIKMIQNGAKGYLLKDTSPQELKQAMQQVFTLGYYYNDYVTRKIIQNVHQFSDEESPLNIVARLSDREIQFLQLACSEKTYVEIAKEMYVSERTVDGYREALFKKLQVSSRVGLVLYALKNDLVHL